MTRKTGNGHPAAGEYFTQASFDFLRDLGRNNDREWFQANKSRYEETVKEPAMRFVADFAPYLKSVSPHFRADPRASGGSIFRIHRDTRFTKDKRPFKTHTGIQFRHDQGRDVHAPGFYLHIEPGSCFAGLGIWRPDGATLRMIRDRIVDEPSAWQDAISDAEFRKRFDLTGDRLSRAPRGFDANHPLIDDLKRKDFVAGADLPDSEVRGAGFLEEFVGLCTAGKPFMAFLCDALELPF